MAYQPFDLTGRVAVITGGNRGIGLGMAHALAAAGADVAIYGRGAARTDAAVAELSGHGTRILGQQVDVTDEGEIDRAVARTVPELGRIDTAVANAGVGGPVAALVDTPTQAFRDVLRVNLDGAFATLRAAAQHMINRATAGDPGGALIGVASLGALEAMPSHYGYAASKAGVVAMIKAAAVELARYGVRANTIAPGWIGVSPAAR